MAKSRWTVSVKGNGNGNATLTIDANTVFGKLQKLYYATKKGSKDMEVIMQDIATIGESYAKSNHRWQNQTGDAERGLTGTVGWEGNNQVSVVLAHTVDYGVYLELGFQKRYAILEESARYASGFLGDRLKGGIEVIIK